jgi:uncharacterized protein with ATP-grasp and redox domains
MSINPTVETPMHRRLFAVAALSAAALFSGHAAADPISPAVQKTVDDFRTQLSKWAANPVVVAAAKSSNTNGGIAGMTPAKWTELAENDPAVTAIKTSAAGKFVDSLDGKQINKVVVRDKAGNLVAANTKVVLYNVSHRPVFKTAITGTPWQQDAVQKDVTTQVKSVQIAVPIKDGADIIGVMHASVSAE